MQKSHITKLFLILLLLCFAYTCTTTEPRKKGFVAKPCLDCHTKTLPEYQKKYIHEPMAKKDCEACHNRHGKIAVLSLKEREQKNYVSSVIKILKHAYLKRFQFIQL